MRLIIIIRPIHNSIMALALLYSHYCGVRILPRRWCPTHELPLRGREGLRRATSEVRSRGRDIEFGSENH